MYRTLFNNTNLEVVDIEAICAGYLKLSKVSLGRFRLTYTNLYIALCDHGSTQDLPALYH